MLLPRSISVVVNLQRRASLPRGKAGVLGRLANAILIFTCYIGRSIWRSLIRGYRCSNLGQLMHSQTSRAFAHLCVLLSTLVFIDTFESLNAAERHYLAPDQPDILDLLPPPPEPDSAEQAADLAEVQSIVKHRTSAENVRGKSETDFGLP